MLCNHVLEHITDDAKAMQELYRVTKKGGTLIAQVPLEEEREISFEDPSIIDPKERARLFGQYDHVRVYGKDYYTRLEVAGFQATAIDFLSELEASEKLRFGLPKAEKIPLGIKL